MPLLGASVVEAEAGDRGGGSRIISAGQRSLKIAEVSQGRFHETGVSFPLDK